ncbi:MAG: SufD family Fe-S cluster assembly protein [Desulfurococcaceae archaeon]|uniref:SufD family Fe-S cluster assembly protein n=1 Tax=Staphylothermus marinus TaxID=2280 RepID=A0A7C4D6T7_STAMA
MNSIKNSVLKALDKPAEYGPDIDLSEYDIDKPVVDDLTVDKLSQDVLKATDRISFNVDNISYIQVNEQALYRIMEKQLSKYGVKIMPLNKALEEYSFARELAWRIIEPDRDKYTAYTYLYGGELGFFIYVPPDTKVPIPVYNCLIITSDKKIQLVHNIIYVDKGSELHVVTGCAVPHGVSKGLHIGISEFYVGENARLTYAMIHAWASGLHVRPRTSVYVEKNSEFVNYYAVYSPVASVQSYPKIVLKENSRVYSATIVSGTGDGVYDHGVKTILSEKNSSSEIVSRVIARDSSKIYARADIEAYSRDTRGHIECLGLLMSSSAFISSIPIISSREPGALLTHEAAIGYIADREVEYLMSKGFDESEAKSLIVRGFMNIDVPGLPISVKREIDRILDIVVKQAVG